MLGGGPVGVCFTGLEGVLVVVDGDCPVVAMGKHCMINGCLLVCVDSYTFKSIPQTLDLRETHCYVDKL